MDKKINITVFLTVLALLIVFVVVLPPDLDAPDYENRSMAEMPVFSSESFLDGSFFAGLDKHLSDRVAYRTSLLSFAGDVELSYGFRLPGSATLVDFSTEDLGQGIDPEVDDEDLYIAMPSHGGDANNNTPGSANTPPSGTGTPPSGGDPGQQSPDDDTQDDPDPAETMIPPHVSPEAPVLPDNHVDPSQPFSVDVYYNEDAVLYERYRENNSAVRRYAAILNTVAGRTPDNVRVFSMLAPIRVEFMGERYSSSSDSQLETIDKINDLLDDRIVSTNTYGWLEAHRDEYIHFRTDHHWTALGAYYAYLSFAEAAGFEPIDISNYIEHSIPDFLGSFGRGTRNNTIREHPDTLYYYELDNGTVFSRRFFVIPEDMSRLSYRFFMGGDYSKLDFTSTNLNGRTLVVVKDSYANALIPWLAPHYERIIVIDPRKHGGSVTRLLRDFEDADLLFVNYVAAASMTDFIETIYSVR